MNVWKRMGIPYTPEMCGRLMCLNDRGVCHFFVLESKQRLEKLFVKLRTICGINLDRGLYQQIPKQQCFQWKSVDQFKHNMAQLLKKIPAKICSDNISTLDKDWDYVQVQSAQQVMYQTVRPRYLQLFSSLDHQNVVLFNLLQAGLTQIQIQKRGLQPGLSTQQIPCTCYYLGQEEEAIVCVKQGTIILRTARATRKSSAKDTDCFVYNSGLILNSFKMHYRLEFESAWPLDEIMSSIMYAWRNFE